MNDSVLASMHPPGIPGTGIRRCSLACCPVTGRVTVAWPAGLLTVRRARQAEGLRRWGAGLC